MKFKNKKIIIGISLMISLLCFSNTVKAEKTITVVEYREKSGFNKYLEKGQESALNIIGDNYYYKFNGKDTVSSKCVNSCSSNDNNPLRFFSVSVDNVTKAGDDNVNEFTCSHVPSEDSYAIAQIISDYNVGTATEPAYYFTELAIQKYLGRNSSAQLNDNFGYNTTNKYYNYIDYAKTIDTLRGKKIKYDGQSELSDVTLKYDEDGQIWKSEIIEAENLNINPKFTITMTDESNKTFNDYVYFTPIKDGELTSYQIGVCNNNSSDSCNKISNFKELPDGKYTITIETRRNLSYAEYYNCTSNGTYYFSGYSSVLVEPSADAPADATITAVLTVGDTTSTGSIKISVVDKDKNLLENVKFKICTDKECENEKYNVTSTDEVYSVPNVPFDTYYVKIISVPDGYVLPKEPIKLELNEEKSNITKTITIDATTKVPDTLSNISKLLILCGIVGIISGTVLVYTNVKKQEQV